MRHWQQSYDKAKRGEFTDVYALAATLYALLTGENPVSALDRQGEHHERQPDPLKPLIQVNPNVSATVSNVVMWGMTLDYKQRPQTVRQWLARLRGESREDITTPPPQMLRTTVLPTLQSILSRFQVQGLSGKQSTLQTIQYWVENRLKSLPKINPWQVRTNKWYLLSVPLILLIALPQAYAYFRYKDFPFFFDLKSLITRLPSSLYLERTLTGISNQGKMIFRSDGQALALLSDGSIQIWNFHTGELLKTISVGQLRPQTSTEDKIISLSPDFKYLATRHDQEVKVWSLNNLNQPPKKLNLGNFTRFTISEDFKYISSYFVSRGLGLTRTVKIWSLETEQVLDILENVNERDKYFVNENRREIVDSQTGKIHRFQVPPGSDNSFNVDLVDINQKHQIAVLITAVTGGSGLFTVKDYRTGERLKAIKIYQLDSGKLIRTISNSYENVESVEISPNGELLFLYEDSIYKKKSAITWADAGFKPGVEIYNLKKGERLFRLPLEKQSGNFNFSGKVAALGERDGIKLVDLNTGKTICTLIDSGINNLTFSPDGQNLISESGGKIRVWKVPE